MQPTITQHAHGALSLPGTRQDRESGAAGRLSRIEALDPEQLPLALAFLTGYNPGALDAALDAVEPDASPLDPGPEPVCTRCGDPVAIFPAHGTEYRHYKGVLSATSKPRPYKSDHVPVIGWRPATDALLRPAAT